MVSRTEWKKGKLGAVQEELNCLPSSSIARKLALLAVGKGDLVASVFPKHEWDIAGGTALALCQSGYTVLNLQSFQEHAFNCAQTISYGLIAGPSHLVEQFNNYWQKNGLQVFQKFN